MRLLIRDFLNSLLDDALEEARLLHAAPADRLLFQGIERALEECRCAMTSDAMAGNLGRLLERARADAAAAITADEPNQWFWFAREAQIEWIANVISVLLLHKRLPTIVPPTRSAAQLVARLAGLQLED